jgi:hypothetical protein
MACILARAGIRGAMESDPSTAEPEADPPPEPQHTVHSEPEEPAAGENEESEGSPEAEGRD